MTFNPLTVKDEISRPENLAFCMILDLKVGI